MKIILDDRRPFPKSDAYNCVRTYDECAMFLRNFRTISYISLDYDLGSDNIVWRIVFCIEREKGRKRVSRKG